MSETTTGQNPTTMRAAVFDRYGSPDVLHIRDLPMPVAGDRELVIRVIASSVNGGELAARRGALRLITGRTFPKRTGIDFAGTVVAIGRNVDPALRGENVWGVMDERGETGSHADYIVSTPDRLAPAPTSIHPADAVSLLAGGTTASQGLRKVAKLRAGERLLVRGAAGGVGSVATQVGKLLGAHVTALSSARTAQYVKGLGADAVIDYTTPLSKLGKYDVVFDTRGTELRQLRRLLTTQGRLITIAFDLEHPLRSLGYIAISAVHGPKRVQLFFGRPDTRALTELAGLVDDGSLKPIVDEIYPLERIAEAHARLERGGVAGKLVISS